MSRLRLVVVDGAELKCSKGVGRTHLRSTNPSLTIIEKRRVATVKDHVAGTNIQPFKECKVTGKSPCEPDTPDPWGSSIFGGVLFASSEDLAPNDILVCKKWGGEITVVESCQSTVDIGRAPAQVGPRADGITPEERERWDASEDWLRTYFPEVADKRYGPEGEDEPERRLNALNAERSDLEKALRAAVHAAHIVEEHAGNVAAARAKAERYKRMIAEKRAEIDRVNSEIERWQRRQQRRQVWRRGNRARFRGR